MNQLLMPKIKGSIINNLNQIIMRRYLLTFLSLVLFLGQSLCLSAQTQTKESKLLMTIGCISDPHCEYGLLTPDKGGSDAVQLRRTFTKTMARIKQEENIDVLLVGGDVTGLGSAPQANWERSRELFVQEVAKTFNTGYAPYMLIASGNHEYQAGGKNYNSADYYSYPIKNWNGELASSECFYENATGASFPLLAAYHYEIKGIDFVVLNTAKYLFASCDDYSYSKESAQWCVNKIDELYEKNPNGTVFFVMHIPFSDSNSISSSSKGISTKDNAPTILKQGLAKHPNTIVLYGHDHGGDKAYTTEKTSQRLTRYDTSGNKMSSVTDVNHVDGTEQPVATEGTTTPVQTVTRTVTCLQNVANGKYLGRDASDINLFSTPQELSVTSIGSNLFKTVITYDGVQYNLSCGNSGRFSMKERASSTGTQENGYWYRVDDINASTITGTRVSSIEKGKNYIIVQNYQGYFALGNALYSSTTQRVISKSLGNSVGNTITIDNNNKAAQAYIYTYKDETITEQTGGETTGSVTPEPSDASFVTLFMGSMRYYNNKMDGSYSSSRDTVASRVIQALMVYVYNDRIELRMKNYGEFGLFTGTGSSSSWYGGSMTPGSVVVYENLTPYTIFRKVVRTTDDEDDDDDEGGEGGEGGDDNPGTDPDPITSDVYYKLATDGEWLPAEISNRSFTLNDATWKGISTEEENEFDAINYVRLFKSLGWQALYVPFEFTVTEDNLKAFDIAKIQGAIAEEDGCTSISYVPLQAGDVVKANTPYVIKARKANSKTAQTLVAEDATLKVPAETGFSVKSATDIYEFNGIYNDKVAEKDAKWYALNSGGTYQHMSKGVVLQPFRIFMNLTPRDDNPYAAKSAPATNQNAKVYYRASIGGAWQEAQISNNTITIDDYNWRGFKADGNRLFSTINYSRLYKSTEWQAWYVPFDLKLTNQILKNFSFAKIQGAIAEEDGNEIIAYVRLKSGDVLNANTPYVVKAKKADSTTPQVISVNNAILQVPINNNGFTVSSASDEYGFYGVSDTRVSTDDDWDQWYAINLSGTYKHLAPGVYLQPFRLYMTINPRSDNPYELSAPQEEVKIRVFGDEFDEADPTAINEINVDAQQQTGKWYNVQGMEVNAPSKGIYIKDGKKYLF